MAQEQRRGCGYRKVSGPIFAAFETLRQRAEAEVTIAEDAERRPSWAPPLILGAELGEACYTLGYLTDDDKWIARLWAIFATPKRSGRWLREWAWDASVQLQADMFAEAGRIGGLEVQLAYFRGLDEFKTSHWTADTRELATIMSGIKCLAGYTQIGRILTHVHGEHEQQRVNAAILIGDAMEEEARTLYDRSAGLGVPLFCFQEGRDTNVERTFREMARLSSGAYCKFNPGSVRELGELLRAVATFAAGGVSALTDLRTDGARKLLGQLK